MTTAPEQTPGTAPPTPTLSPPGSAPLLRGLGVALALVTVLAGALAVAGSLARDSTSQQHRYQGVRVVEVDVDAESVEVVTGPGDVTRLERSIAWSAGRPTLRQEQVGERLVVGSACPFSFGRGCSGRVRLVVPAGTRVTAHSSGGSVEVTGLDGVLDLSSSAGDVGGTALRAATVVADSSAGDVDLRFSAAPTRVRATSSAGDVAVALPEGPEAYRVDAGSSAGSRDVRVRTDPSSRRTVFAHSSAGDVAVLPDRLR